MKIVIDARMYGPRRWTGIGRYLEQLVAELEQLESPHEYVVLLQRENFDEYTPGSARFRKLLAPWAPYTFGEQLRLPWLLYRLRADMVHFPAPNAPLLYWRRHVTTIHDLTLIFFPTSRYRGLKRVLQGYKRLPFRLVMWWMAKFSAAVITPTQYVKDQVVQRYGVAPERVAVTLEAITPAQVSPLLKHKRFEGMEPYVLYVGVWYPYKNIGRLIEAFARSKVRQAGTKLVLVGKADYFRQELERKVQELGVAASVVFTGFVEEAELVQLYQKAAAYVFPSLSEGFGLPGLEAMSYGVPVLAARASCLPEVYGEAARYFNPLDPADMARQLDALLSDPDEQERLRAAGRERIGAFSWHRMAAQTLAAYEGTGRK